MLTTNQILQQGRFRVIQPLGQNSSGLDYEAFDSVYNTNVILREIPFGIKKSLTAAQSETLKNSFADEAKVLMRIQHPAILKVHGYVSEIGVNYLITEFADGNYLSEMLKKAKNQSFPLTNVSNWTEKILDALGYLHNFAPPIVHRNIKPENLKLTLKGEIKLLITALTEEADTNISKLNYLPLEQIWKSLDAASQNLILNSYDENAQKNLEKAADASSDIYALGATLYHLLTAQTPVDALERSIEILEGNADPLKPPHEINPAVPKEISDVLIKALEIRRENRFHSAVIMRQVWRTALVRVQEREAAAVNSPETEDVLDIPIVVVENNLDAERQQLEQERLKIEAEQKRLEEERRMVEQERLKIEAARKQQAEILLEQHKTQIEEEKLKAEQIVEEEKLETAPIVEPSAIEELFSEIIEETAPPEEEFFTEITGEMKPVEETIDFMASFGEQPNELSGFKRIAAVAAALIVFGIAGFGIWFFTTSKSVENYQTAASSEQTVPKMSVETATMPPKTEDTPEAKPSPSDSPEKVQTLVNPAPVKAKPTATPAPAVTPKPEVKKPSVAEVKKPEPQKKPVTVDDLINDN